MSQDVESIYEEYISKLKQVMPNVDPNFVHRIMYVERELGDYDTHEPFVSAIIEYKPSVDLNIKVNGLREKYSLEVEHGDKHNTLHVESRMTVDKIKGISADRDIIKISGKSNVGLGE
jgi:hypothetical protein